MASGSAMLSAMRHLRIERGARILKHDLHLAGQQRARSRGGSASCRGPRKSRGRRSPARARDRVGGRRLAAAAFADQRDGAASGTSKEIEVDRLHDAPAARAARTGNEPSDSRTEKRLAARLTRPPRRDRHASMRRRCHRRTDGASGGAVAQTSLGERAARAEAAAVRPGVGDGHHALDGAQQRLALALEPRDRREQQPRVGMARAARRAPPPAPLSTIRPPYITQTSSAISATTPMSWVISRIVGAGVARSVSHQFEDLRLDRDVERRRRLVGDQQRRAGRSAPRRS